MIPISAVKAGMFFTERGGVLYYVVRLKAKKQPEVRKMLYSEVRWLPPTSAYGAKDAPFHSPDTLVTPLSNEELLKWNRNRFVLATRAMVRNSDQKVLRGLAVKALAPATRQLREIGAPAWSKSEIHKSLYGGPDEVQQTTAQLIVKYQKAKDAERIVQTLLDDLYKEVQVEAGDVELELWDLFSHARQYFESAVIDAGAQKGQEVIETTKARCLEWVRKQVARHGHKAA